MRKATSMLLVTFVAVLFSQVSLFAGPVPDTGQTTCYDDSTVITCPQPGEAFYGQDASYTINPPSFTKLDANGNDLPDSAAEWAMVRDNVTGLIWEVKQAKNGSANYADPHDADNTYTWYDSNPATNGGNAGTPGDGTDTEDFIAALNAASYGGHNDWRLPTVKELQNLADMGRWNPSIDSIFFSNTQASYYRSSTTFAYSTDYAWVVYFNYGYDNFRYKSYAHFVRAVRGGQSRSLDHWLDNGDGTVTDTITGLMWQQATAAGTYTWEQSLAYCEALSFAGHDDWRLPTEKELRSIVDDSRYSPAIDPGVFSNTQASDYWSSTTRAYDTGLAWLVDFDYGSAAGDGRSSAHYVRAVRGGQPRLSGHLAISSPGQGSAWDAGTQMPIAWDIMNIPGDVAISLSRDGGKTWETIAAGTPNDGAHTWTVAGEATVNGMLKIDPLENGFTDKGSVQGLFALIQPVATDDDGDGYAETEGDCDDSDPAVHPGAAEVCDGIDNNCNQAIDEGCVVLAPDTLFSGYPSAQTGSADPVDVTSATPFFSAINRHGRSIDGVRIQLAYASDTGYALPVWDSGDIAISALGDGSLTTVADSARIPDIFYGTGNPPTSLLRAANAYIWRMMTSDGADYSDWSANAGIQTVASGTMTARFYENKDTFYGTAFNTSGQGDNVQLKTGGWGDYYYSYLQWDFDGAPPGADVTACTLNLTCERDDPNDPQIYVRRVTSEWDEHQLSLADHPQETDAGQISIPKPAVGQVSAVDITTLCSGWLGNSFPNYGLKLHSTYNVESRHRFYSEDQPGIAYDPFIEVVYTVLNTDTDGDGLPNTWETEHGLNPDDPEDASQDADNDGLTNLEEFTRQTDPQNPDSDADGMPDGWEVQYGLDPLVNDASGDLDGDGITNLDEYLAGINPQETTPPKPVLLLPADGATNVSLTTPLKTKLFFSAAAEEKHVETRWQISTAPDFTSLVLDVMGKLHLTLIEVPTFVLAEGETYYWRVRFFGDFGIYGNATRWSDPFSFTTLTTTADQDGNGIPDTQDNLTADMDGDGTADYTQDHIKSLNTVLGNGQMGVSKAFDEKVSAIESIESLDPRDISEYGRPYSMPLGLFAIKLRVLTPGDAVTVRIYFSEAMPEGSQWFLYDSIQGWKAYAGATLSEDRKSASLALTDGGDGDADGIANGVIADPGGFGLATWVMGYVTDAETDAPIDAGRGQVNIGGVGCPIVEDQTGDQVNFLCLMLPGTYDLKVSADGYGALSAAVTIPEVPVHYLTPPPYALEPGVDIQDIVTGLQLLVGTEGLTFDKPMRDYSGDNLMGLEEMLYLMQKAAGLH